VPKGLVAVYTSATLSLAALELFVHTDPDLVPADLLAISADIPDDLIVHELALLDLPGTWREIPAPAELQELGRSWIVEGKAAMLSVPSVVVPTERNYVLNPAHVGFKRIQIGEAYDFSFDPRGMLGWKARGSPCTMSSAFCRTEKPLTHSLQRVFRRSHGLRYTSVLRTTRIIGAKLICWWRDRRRTSSREVPARP
jgi:RES domain-containing protein